MASALWGNVYFGDTFAGTLSELAGGRTEFRYDNAYVSSNSPPVSHTLPLTDAPYITESGLHPFFDNLVSEGWLQAAQCRALGVDRNNRLALLLAFGQDCAGAVSVVDPEKFDLVLDPDLYETAAALRSRASLAGVQAKVFAVKEGSAFRAAMPGELSTHIAKLQSKIHPDLTQLEWLTTQATRALLPKDPLVDLEFGSLPGFSDEVLMIKRFDRVPDRQRIHFEEFNTLLGNRSDDKYEGSYEQMGCFIQKEPSCIPAEAERLFRRILACFLLGNTDAHLKNFAMMHADGGLRLSPSYDLVASAFYKEYDTLALRVFGAESLSLSELLPKHLLGMAAGVGLAPEVLLLAVEDFERRRGAMTEAIETDRVAPQNMKTGLLELIDKRWNRTFALVGTTLSKRQKGVEKLRGFRKRG